MEDDCIPKTKAELFASLAAHGIAKATIAYDGCGDSGCIEDIKLYATKSWEDRIERQCVPLRRAVESWCYDLLQQHFEGWENDAGACGEFDLDITAGTCVIQHNTRYTEYQEDRVEV
jgi:hypothetical protein